MVWLSKYHLVANFGNMTPFWDQWDAEAAGLYRPWVEGSLRWTDLLAAHNEHRILTTRIIALSLFLLNGGIWNTFLLMQVNAVVYAAAVSFLICHLSRLLAGWRRVLLFPIAAGVFILPYAWENTLMGVGGTQFYTYLLLNSVFFWVMASRPSYTLQWWFGFTIGALTILTMASGAVTLAAGALLLGIRRFLLRDAQIRPSSVVLLAVMAAIAVATTPTIPSGSVLRAHSLEQFIGVLLLGASWPFPPSVVAAVLVHAPLVLFTALVLLRRIPATPTVLYVFALAAWLYAQLLLISYGRAAAADASRYLDFHAVTVALSAAALLYLASKIQRKWEAVPLLILWLASMACGFFLACDKWNHDVLIKCAQSREQEKNVREYLLTKNPASLLNKRYMEIPYPKAERLKALLDSPTIQALLPPELSHDNKVR